MGSYKINYLESALHDLEEIILHIAGDSKGRALRWRDDLIQRVDRLSLFPESGPKVPDQEIALLEIRMLTIGSYLLFYRIFEREKEVTVLRVLNARQSYSSLFKDQLLIMEANSKELNE